MNRLRTQNGEEGWALVTAVAMMAIMLVIGLATMATVDFNSQQTRQQRESESALNLAEGVLYAQSFALARRWPAPGRPAYPTQCSSSTATTGQCPNRENLAAANAANANTAAFNSTDFSKTGLSTARNTTWITRVRDNYGALANAYTTNTTTVNGALTGSLGTCAAPCSRDFNNDRAMWVESRTVVRGKARKIAALMRLEMLQESIPKTGMTSGAMALTNNGAGSYDASGAAVVVRCSPDSSQGNGATCTNISNNNSITPAPVQGTVGNLMSPDQINRFRDRAIIEGTWYANCSSVPSLTGQLIFIEYCPASGSDPGPTYRPSGTVCSTGAPALPSGMSNSCYNSIQKPGLVIVRCGGLRLSQGTYVGVLYFVNGSDQAGNNCNGSGMPTGQTTGQDRGNPSNPQCPRNAQRDPSLVVLDVQNGAGIWGAIAADGGACIQLGSNGHQFDFDPNVFAGISTYGTVGLVQNTWRELPPGTS
jgi:Tfp pilus assembly protein PilX